MKPLRILLIEPEPDLCGSIASVLNDAGYVVVSMSDFGVLAHLDTFIQVDLIIVDADGDADRIPQIEALMTDLRYKNRILVVLCYCISDHEPRLLRAGAGHVILKPLDLEELERMVRSMLPTALN